MDRYPRTWVEIDLAALRHNLGLIRESIGDPSVKLALVAKADAYGHGLVPVSSYALHHGADWVAVATVQEGVALRESGIEAPIMVISAILTIEAEDAIFYNLRVLVEHIDIAKALSEAAVKQNTVANIHLEVDTGLARFGCMPSDAIALTREILALPNVKLEGVSTHFANSSADPETTERQMDCFYSVLEDACEQGFTFEIIHLANSAGTVRYPRSRGRLVRTGIASYGIDPYNLFGGREKSVLNWKARVMALRTLEPGAPVSYSSTYHTSRKETIATLGVGYGDGYPRALSNKGFVSINGHRAPVVGLVCMDQVLVDVTDFTVKLGDIATIAGGDVPVTEMAKLAQTNPHEITCRLMPRVPKHYLFD